MSRVRRSAAGRPGASGAHERHLALSTAALQASQAVGVLAMLVSITVLARRLPLPEFGTYGLLVSLSTYLVFIQGSVETAAVKGLAEATDQRARDRAFSTALTLYTVTGVVAGAAIATAGSALLSVFDIPASLHHEAQASVFALAAATSIGWPLKVFQDVLRGSRLFALSATAEIVAYVTVGGALVGLGLVRAPLWLLVSVGASLPAATGAASACVVLIQRMPYRYERALVTRESVRSFLRLSSYLFLIGISDLVIYSLDRAILAAFRSAATVGLYEGPVRAHNLIRQLNATLSVTVLPTSARYLAEGDAERTRDLLVRGTRYVLATVVPLTVVLMILAKPILEVWLGPKFSSAATAMTLLVAYWLIGANTGVAGSMLIAAGKARQLTVFAAVVAVLNLALSLVLTPSLGLNGVVLGTTIPYVLILPFFVALAISVFPVTFSELAREAWLPAYTTAAVIAASLGALRASVSLDTVPEVAGAATVALLAYWTIYYIVWLRPDERSLVKNVALVLARR
jgi:O-antigen/teichoic acid export membrane protein